MKIIITGGRKYSDKDFVFSCLDQTIPVPTRIIQGGASGADAHARAWAKANGVQCVTYHANWDLPNYSGGPIRNKAMAEDGADLCYAFLGGKGTAGMCQLAHDNGIQVILCDVDLRGLAG